MKIVNILIIAIVALLSIAAGLAKVMQTQQEMEFLQGVGLSSFLIVVFGIIQVSGGVLLIPRKTRMAGAVLAAVALGLSSVFIFMGGNLAFGLFSLLPVVLVCVIIYQTANVTADTSLKTDTDDNGTG